MEGGREGVCLSGREMTVKCEFEEEERRKGRNGRRGVHTFDGE